jgi:ornithine aminotransferase
MTHDFANDPASRALIERERAVCAGNYAPLPVVVESAEGAWITDVAGRRYLDFMSAYSAVSHGHRHPRLVAAAHAQMARVCVTSRAYHGDTLGAFAAELCRLSGFGRVLPMNTGAEAVETAIKAARRWAYRVRGIAPERAVILVAESNFHGRTSTIVGFSSEPDYRNDFGPFAPAFRHFRFGDMASLDAAWDEHVCAVLVEPIQGEAGIVVPPAGWLRALRQWCDRRGVLLLLDEVQSGLGRTGRMFAFEHEGIRPDGLILGKALGGGILPVSAFVADDAVMRVFGPGSHGSTFGGNALAAAVALEALRVLQDEQLPERSAVLGRHLLARLEALAEGRPIVVRGRGLWAGVELRDAGVDAAALVARLAQHGVLTKETHETVIRIAPPLTITKTELDLGLDRLSAALDEYLPRRAAAAATAATTTAAPASAATATQATRAAEQAPHLLLCAPEHFEVSYRINPWMEPDAWTNGATRFAASAREGWRQLRDAYLGLGARIETMPPQPGLPDMVFTANSAVVLDGKVVLARFLNPERRGEEAHGQRMFEALTRRGIVQSLHETPAGVWFEGAGDAIWDQHRRLFWMGYGQRSSLAARDTLRRVYGVDTVSLELASPRFYHLDTCLCLLSGGEILWYPPAFTPATQALLRALAGDALIEAGDEDANRFGVNAVSIGRDLIMAHCSQALQQRLERHGHRVVTVPLEAFGRAGGGAYCLTLRLDQRSDDAPPCSRKLAA